MNIFLIGLMGSGKTFWAQKLSALLSIPAFDLDNEIEKKEGNTVAAIFSAQGEDQFRKKESDVLKSFGDKGSFILSTGGGTPCFHNNMDWMNEHGTTIWIDEPAEVIAGKLKKEKSHRPLIANVADEDLKDFLAQMRNKRRVFYSKAKYHLSNINITEKDFLKIIEHE